LRVELYTGFLFKSLFNSWHIKQSTFIKNNLFSERISRLFLNFIFFQQNCCIITFKVWFSTEVESKSFSEQITHSSKAIISLKCILISQWNHFGNGKLWIKFNLKKVYKLIKKVFWQFFIANLLKNSWGSQLLNFLVVCKNCEQNLKQ
jgi:hypothetical protein